MLKALKNTRKEGYCKNGDDEETGNRCMYGYGYEYGTGKIDIYMYIYIYI